MSESALARLLRLKKEKEQASAPVTLAEVEVEVTKLEEAVQEVKEGQAEVKVGLAELTQGIAETKAAVNKPMSAMDRIRAMKAGGSANGTSSSGSTVSVATPGNPVRDLDVARLEEPKPELPPKPRKTHPIAMEMAELEAALDAEVPGFVTILSQIHKKLRADPNVVTLLDDEEIGRIVAGLEKHTNVTIVAPSAIKAAKAKKKEPVSAMDL